MAFLAIILLGFGMACAQVTLLRESLAAANGNEMTVALGLSLWLLGSALGAGVGSFIPDRWARPALAIAAALSAAAPFAALHLARGAAVVFHVAPGELLSLSQQLAAGALALGPVCLLIGATFALACRLPGLAPRQVYLAEAIGWLLGGVAATWLLVALPPFAIFLMLALPTAAAVGLLWKPGWGIAALIAVAVAVLGLLRLPARWEARTLAHQFPAQAVRDSAYTRAGHVVILERDGQVAVYENGKYAMALPEPQTARAMAHLALLQVEGPRQVLLIGGLGGLLPEVLRYPVAGVTLVEEDAGAARVVLRHVDDATRAALDDPRVRLRCGDGRRLLATGAWDVVLVSLPPPSTLLLNRYYSAEFFNAVCARLRPGGVLVFILPGSTIQTGGEAVARNGAVFRALAAAFPRVMLAAGDGIYFLASDRPLCADPAEMGQRLLRAGVQTPEVDQYFFYSVLDGDTAAFLAEQYAAEPRPNRDLEPVACQQELLLWGHAESGWAAKALRALAGAPAWLLGLLMFGVTLLGAGVAALPWRRGALAHGRGLLAVAVAGFAGMALNVLILLLAQVTLGALYALLGALMAVGMAGIAAGAWLGGRVRVRFAVPLLLGVALALLLPALAGLAAAWPFAAGALLLAAAALLAGMMVGLAFPLAAAAGLSPAAIYAADLLGAAAAGLLAGAVLLPAHGLLATCLLTAILCAFTAILCWTVRPTRM